MDNRLQDITRDPPLIAALILILAALLAIPVDARSESRLSAQDLLLAKVYDEAIDPRDYWVSEKLDGVRALWDGQRLLSRNGYTFKAPRWFTRGFPKVPLDGELWMGRNTYEALSSTVRKTHPEDVQWRKVRFMVFDLPAARVNFSQRYEQLATVVDETDSPYLGLVEQVRVSGRPALMEMLDAVMNRGGEGLMLHRANALYQAGRSDDLLKLKRYRDAEATVIAHQPGNGRFSGLLGSLLVETKDGKRFRIGSGFTDEQRHTPPPRGSVITYKYFGVTANGIPRFASFLRVREER